MGYEFLLLSHYKFFLATCTGINLYFWDKKYEKYKFIVACGMGVRNYLMTYII